MKIIKIFIKNINFNKRLYQYKNPKHPMSAVAATIIDLNDNSVLFAKRKNPPWQYYFSLPGFNIL
jgi:hypothetical protein